MAEGKKTGTVTYLDSLFSSEEAEKAARLVDEAIANRKKELNRLLDFITDNSALIRHVQKLPDELSHDIMVPFGGAAFFPGRLIHTNEFMVLLGEGYYVERSAKQTVEILQRRAKDLEGHRESLTKIIKDLDAEAKFFDSTAAEISEGLVEIREEYVEETQKEPEKDLSSRNVASPSKSHDSVVSDEEDEDAKLMARLDELEKEEEEAANNLGQDEDVETAGSSDVDEDEDEDAVKDEDSDEDEVDAEEDEEEEDEDDDDEYVHDNAKKVFEPDAKGRVPVSLTTGSGILVPPSLQRTVKGFLQSSSNQSSVSGSKMQISTEGSLGGKAHLQNPPRSNIQDSSGTIPSQSSMTGSAESKAFPGAVIERSYGLPPANPNLGNDSNAMKPSRPVSRFKMQRGNK